MTYSTSNTLEEVRNEKLHTVFRALSFISVARSAAKHTLHITHDGELVGCRGGGVAAKYTAAGCLNISPDDDDDLLRSRGDTPAGRSKPFVPTIAQHLSVESRQVNTPTDRPAESEWAAANFLMQTTR
jgi:hypothetical protein